MPYPPFDFVIPLYQARWNTRAVLEGLTVHYAPRAIHIITPAAGTQLLAQAVKSWQTAPVHVHEEDSFFGQDRLTKDAICAELDLGKSLYPPGWFYQQLLKLGAAEGIEGLSEWYVVWDSDLLPVSPWPLMRQRSHSVERLVALLQHNQWGNPQIVSTWNRWIRSVLGVEPLTDSIGTFIPHHMWFKQSHLIGFQQRLQQYFQSDDDWLLLMMRSANQFGTFSEYWAYASWVAATAPEDFAFYPYGQYGETTERFFDDGTGLFSIALRRYQSQDSAAAEFSPTYAEVEAFIRAEYGADPLPSSLSFESSPRHLKKRSENMHIEELRSRWNPRISETTAVAN
ncbi:MAG: hypothetical protein F6J97_25370 [Leptolyngbya sp. SIO4C1]|nr:hypothetical protein [Leptolyngbya sp. SIO4C1]